MADRMLLQCFDVWYHDIVADAMPDDDKSGFLAKKWRGHTQLVLTAVMEPVQREHVLREFVPVHACVDHMALSLC